jgi:hypothetical protein
MSTRAAAPHSMVKICSHERKIGAAMWQQNAMSNQRRIVPSNRPTMIIRSSKEERMQDDPSTQTSGFEFDQLGAAAPPLNIPTVSKPEVFVSRRCPFSGELVDYAQLLKIPITIIDIDSQGAPAWLPGVPTVRDKGAGYCGDSAFTYLKHIADQQTSNQQKQPSVQQQQSQQVQQQQQQQPQPQQSSASPFMSAPAAADSSMGAGLASVYSSQAQQGMMADFAADARCELTDMKETERSMARLMDMRKPLENTGAIRK